MTYSGIFEAIVDNGDPNSKQGKLVFELRKRLQAYFTLQKLGATTDWPSGPIVFQCSPELTLTSSLKVNE